MAFDGRMGHEPSAAFPHVRGLAVVSVLLVLLSVAAKAIASTDSPAPAAITDAEASAAECLELASLLEPATLMERLSGEQWACLLASNADQATPEEHVELCFNIALYLSRQGWTRADEVVEWAEAALENRAIWEGDTYTARVYALLQVRAVAAMEVWEHAELRHATAPSYDTHRAVEMARSRTQVFAREWYAFAERVSADPTRAMKLCVSAAGNPGYCEDSPAALYRRFDP